ncbi:MAG TPA: hypothetical protein VJQ53_00085 [Candidatus Eisenbacteria bacterium]|nr:hypothetical protein [Candidatus Eisenbacteria bacterium]
MKPAYEALLGRLKSARRILLWRAIERAGLAAIVGLLAIAFLALTVALLAPLYRTEYSMLRLALLGAAAVFFLTAVARVLASEAALADAALAAGKLAGDREDELLAALELSRDDPERGAWTSSALREAAVEAAAARAGGIELGRLKRWEKRGRWLGAAGVALLLIAVASVVGGAKTPLVLQRISDPRRAPLAPIRIRVEPGTREVEGGESVALHAYVAGSGRRPQLLTRGPAGWRETNFGNSAGADGARHGERAYTLLLRNLNEDVVYRVRVADQETPTYALNVRDLPRATGYRILYEYPAYTGLKPEVSQAITGDLAAPRGTRAILEVSVNRAVAKASARFEGAGQELAGQPGERSARFSVPIRADDRYSIRLEDQRGRRSDLGPFDLHAIPDRPPTVTVLAPAPVEDVARDMTTVVLAGATDDHGVRKILLRYRVRQEPERVEVLHEEKEGARELAIRYTWALGGYSLLPGEEVEYQLGAVDGNAIDGPQTTWSDARRLRFPSATEILASMESERDESIQTLQDALKGARELQQKSDELSRDVGRSRELSWEQRQEIQKTAEGQERLREQIDKVAQKLSQDAEKLSQSRALNAELVQKIQELQQLLSQIKDQNLLRSMQRLQEAMKRISPQEMERALQNFKLSQEDAMKNLERTIEMLKQIRTEEMLEAASERAAEMERRQLAVNDSLSRAGNKEDVGKLGGSERQIASMAEEQRTALDSLSSELRSQDAETAEESSRLSQKLGPQGMQPQFQRTRESMESGDQEQSQEQAKDLAQNLQELRKSVDKMREEFAAKRKNELAKKMEQSAQDLLDIASIQEDMLGDETSSLSTRAETQKGLQESTEGATNRIAEVAKQTLFITPDIAQSLGRALSNQSNAVGRYSNQDLAGGITGSKEAAIALNQAAGGLLRQKDSMQGSKSSTGMQEAMEKLQSLAGQQEGLNEEAMGMMPSQNPGDGQQGNSGRLREGMGNALGRMAAEQEAIRQGLEEATQKLGQNGGTLGRLGDVSEDMKKVEQDFRSGRLNQDTVDRQQKILSRLLDAPRSVEKRDYSRRRVSRPGVDVVRSSPGALSGDLLKSRPSLAALLARGSRDPIAPRYRATVDEYFQSILEGKAR